MATGFALQGLTLSAAGAELSAADSEYRLDVVAMRAVAALIASDDSDHSAAWRAMRTGIGAMRRAEAKAQKQKQAAAGFGAAASMCVIMGCFLASSRACFCIWRVCVLVFIDGHISLCSLSSIVCFAVHAILTSSGRVSEAVFLSANSAKHHAAACAELAFLVQGRCARSPRRTCSWR